MTRGEPPGDSRVAPGAGKKKKAATKPRVPKPPETLVARLKYARKLRGFTPRRLSILAGRNPAHVAVMESRDSDPDRVWDSTIQKLAHVLDVDFRWLRYGDGELPQPIVATTPPVAFRGKRAPKIKATTRARVAGSHS